MFVLLFVVVVFDFGDEFIVEVGTCPPDVGGLPLLVAFVFTNGSHVLILNRTPLKDWTALFASREFLNIARIVGFLFGGLFGGLTRLMVAFDNAMSIRLSDSAKS